MWFSRRETAERRGTNLSLRFSERQRTTGFIVWFLCRMQYTLLFPSENCSTVGARNQSTRSVVPCFSLVFGEEVGLNQTLGLC